MKDTDYPTSWCICMIVVALLALVVIGATL